MGVLKLGGFAGAWPIKDVRALPDNGAAEAVNLWPDSGALRGLSGLQAVKGLLASTRRVYRIPLGDVSQLTNSFWMEFADADTDVVRTPIVNDSFERYYWASPSTGLKYASKANILSGGAVYDVGIPAPATPPNLHPVAGTGELDANGKNTAKKQTRTYVCTFVSIYGEEGPPGPDTDTTCYSDQDVLVDNIPQPAAAGAQTPIAKVKIYRTVTSATGSTDFYFVAERTVGTTFYMDHLSDSTVSGQGILGSILYNGPPAGLQGIVAMPNGIFVGWIGNTLYFSENFRPHAWPVQYQLTVEYPIVGLGVVGNTCVVCTKGHPCAVTGTRSANMALVTYPVGLPCLSRRGIVSAPEGVYYPSETGLVLIGTGGPQLVTEGLIGRDKWATDYLPSTLRSIYINGTYTAVRQGQSNPNGFAFMPGNQGSGLTQIQVEQAASDVGMDVWSGRATLIAGQILYQWLVPGQPPLKYRWRSKEFTAPKPCNFSTFQVYYDQDANPLTVRAWATLRGNAESRQLVFEMALPGSGQEIRMPSGFLADIWQFEFEGTANVHNAIFATSTAELRQV